MSIKVRAIPTEVYSRVVGYYRPVQNWNRGKQEEFKQRNYLRGYKIRDDKGNSGNKSS